MKEEKKRIQEYLQRWEALKAERAELDLRAKDVSDYICPSRGRYQGDANQPDRLHGKRGDKIIDSTSCVCHEVASNGLHSGLTPPSRQWFQLSFADSALNEYGTSPRSWLDELRDAVRSVLRKSNFYTVIHNSYAEIVAFATSCIRMEDDPYDGLRFRSYTYGQYWVACGPSGRVDTLYRLDNLTARQIVNRWGETKEKDLPNIMKAFEDTPYQSFDVLHVVQPRNDRDPTKIDKKNKRWESTYIAIEGDRCILSESGFDAFPYAVGRWTVIGTDVYGTDSPGMRMLPDVKGLQDIEESTIVAIHREVDPPVVAPSGMAHVPIRKNPGGVTYFDSANPEALRPLYAIQFNIAAAGQKAMEIRQRILKGFYNDLFLAITALEQQSGNVTATQVLQMQQEKLLQLGPFIERQENEVLDPVIEFVVRHVVANAKAYNLPPPPPELTSLNYKIEYVSLLAMAQQSTQVRVIDEALMAVGQMAQMFPTILDVIDPDETFRERCAMSGAPAAIFRMQDAIDQIRADRKEQEAAMAQTQQGMAMAQAAGDLGKVKMNPQDPNVVSRLIEEAANTGVI